jgi:hypothetical protein
VLWTLSGGDMLKLIMLQEFTIENRSVKAAELCGLRILITKFSLTS